MPEPAAAREPFTVVHLPDGSIWENPYEPSVDAVKYHATTGRRVLAGGSRGGGKTRTEVEDFTATAIKWPGIPQLVGRKDLSDLKRTVMSEFLKRVPEQLYDPKYGGQFHKTDNFVRLFNGSVIHFVELKDINSQRSMNLGRVYLDEMHEVPNGEDVMRELAATLRWTTESGTCKRDQCVDDARELAANKGTTFEEEYKPHAIHPVRQIKMMTNPTGNWLKGAFYTPWREHRLRDGWEYIPFSVFNNPGVDAAYINDLMDNNPKWVRNFVYGEWDEFENLAYPTFNRSAHLWRGPVPWERVRAVEGGIDWGSAGAEHHRTAMYLTARLNTGEYITFWEHSVAGAQTAELYAMIKRMTLKHHVQRWWSDASQFVSNGHLRSSGIPVSDAPRHKGARKDGINLGNLLMEKGSGTGKPGWYYTEDCTRLPNAFEGYELDPETGEPMKQDDDEMDAWRYNIMGFATKAETQSVSVDFKVKHPEVREGPRSSILRRRAQERSDRLRQVLDEERKWQPLARK